MAATLEKIIELLNNQYNDLFEALDITQRSGINQFQEECIEKAMKKNKNILEMLAKVHNDTEKFGKYALKVMEFTVAMINVKHILEEQKSMLKDLASEANHLDHVGHESSSVWKSYEVMASNASQALSLNKKALKLFQKNDK